MNITELSAHVLSMMDECNAPVISCLVGYRSPERQYVDVLTSLVGLENLAKRFSVQPQEVRADLGAMCDFEEVSRAQREPVMNVEVEMSEGYDFNAYAFK